MKSNERKEEKREGRRDGEEGTETCLNLQSIFTPSTAFSSLLLHPPPPPPVNQAHWSTGRLISANDNMEFSKRGQERKSESGMERIENSFIPLFFFYNTLSLFLLNDNLRPLDFQFLSVCLAPVCSCVHYVTRSYYRVVHEHTQIHKHTRLLDHLA